MSSVLVLPLRRPCVHADSAAVPVPRSALLHGTHREGKQQCLLRVENPAISHFVRIVVSVKQISVRQTFLIDSSYETRGKLGWTENLAGPPRGELRLGFGPFLGMLPGHRERLQCRPSPLGASITPDPP